jgi:glycosyltransferase involved in cell wall biosynthesis
MGGAERSLIDLLGSLRGHAEVGLLTLEDGPLVQMSRDLNVPTTIVSLPDHLLRLGDFGGSASLLDLLARPAAHPLGATRAIRAFSAAIADFRPSVVHSNGIKTHLLSGLVGPGGAKLVWHIRDFIGSRRIVRTLAPRLSSRVSAAFAISRAVETDLRDVLPDVPVAVVYNAVDLEHFRPRQRSTGVLDSAAGIAPAPRDALRIGLVATYARWKGHRVFLEAAALALRRTQAPLRFFVIGGPIYLGAEAQITERELRAWIDELGISESVGLVPFVDVPEQVFNELDIAVNSNTAPEPFGRTIVEALASGVPVVTGPDAGALEELPDGAVERLPVLSAETLATALASLAVNPDRRAELSRLGPIAARRYSRERLKTRVLELYRCLAVT